MAEIPSLSPINPTWVALLITAVQLFYVYAKTAVKGCINYVVLLIIVPDKFYQLMNSKTIQINPSWWYKTF